MSNNTGSVGLYKYKAHFCMSRAVLSENRPSIPELEFCWMCMVSVIPCPACFLIIIWAVFRLWNPQDAHSTPDFCLGSASPVSRSLSSLSMIIYQRGTRARKGARLRMESPHVSRLTVRCLS